MTRSGNYVETNTHKILDWLNHLWPILSGIVLIFFASLRLLWFRLTHKYVTKEELQKCRIEVQKVDKAIMDKLDHLIETNSKEHQEILRK